MHTLPCTLLLAAASTIPAQERLLQAADLPVRRAVAAELARIDARALDLNTTVALTAISASALPEGSAARRHLHAALERANAAPTACARALRTLRQELGDVLDTLTFRPLAQADLPDGFPGFAAVDELELRHYPAYRMARTAMRSGSLAAFWPLFRHIESNGIAMTTPVQMDWPERDDEAMGLRPASMAFLYGHQAIDPQDTAAGVEVVDVPAASVLCVGAIGDDRRDRVAGLQARLLRHLAAADSEWQLAGELRTFHYNSPMVPRDRRYFEVQVPVRRSDENAGDTRR